MPPISLFKHTKLAVHNSCIAAKGVLAVVGFAYEIIGHGSCCGYSGDAAAGEYFGKYFAVILGADKPYGL